VTDQMKQTLGNNALIFDPYVADWTVIMLPYCTQDLHFGNNTAVYTSGSQSLAFHHVGSVNSQAALKYVFENMPNPEMIVVTGCSAGSLGVVISSFIIRQHYSTLPSPPAISVFPDSEFGLISDIFSHQYFLNWGTSCLSQMLSEPFFNLSAPDFWKSMFTMELFWDAAIRRSSTNEGPPAKWFVYSNTRDRTQKSFYTALGGNPTGFEGRMVRFAHHLNSLTHVRVWIMEGHTHCTLAGSVAMTHPGFRDWLLQGFNSTQSSNTPMPESQICSNCYSDTCVGCDGVTGSGVVTDVCEVCGGDGTSCIVSVPSWINSSLCSQASSPWHDLMQSNNLHLDTSQRLATCSSNPHSLPMRAFDHAGLEGIVAQLNRKACVV